VGVLIICVLVFTVFCIVSFMYILICYWCKDYCHRVKTQLQMMMMMMMMLMMGDDDYDDNNNNNQYDCAAFS